MTAFIKRFAGLLRFAIEPNKGPLSVTTQWLYTAFATHSSSKASLTPLKPLPGAALLLATFATPKGGMPWPASPHRGSFPGIRKPRDLPRWKTEERQHDDSGSVWRVGCKPDW